MKKLFIHIGSHKTGSSALQRSLICNQRLLESNDLHFLEYSLFKNAGILRSIDLQDNQKIEDERLNLENKISARKEGNIILSCEEYVGNLDKSYTDSAEMAIKLAQVTESYPRKIVIYIRRQDEFIESSYAQYVKQGAHYSFEKFLSQYNIYKFDWFKLLATYSELFGKENLLIRPYEKQQLFEGDVVKDFYQTIGISSFELLEEHTYSNHGYSRAGLEIARIYNKIYAADTEKKKRLKSMLQNRMRKRPYDSFDFFSYPDRLKLLEFYQESNKQVAIEYFHRTNGVLFEDSMNEYESEKLRKNRLTLADLMEGIEAFFLKPVASKICRMLKN